MKTLPDTARATVERYGMLPAGAAVLAMVSGGADSVAMLHLLARGEVGRLAYLSVLHVNHLLRAADADADESFVSSLCERLGVPLRVVRYDVAAYARESGLNLEDAGRQVRYRFAAEEIASRCDAAAIDPGLGRIAVAHTRDDRLETLLMRLATGAGATGMTSLRPVRDSIVRPLVDAPRALVRDYLESEGEPWCEDASNADTSRLRARIRHELLPMMRDINPGFDETAARTIELLAGEDDLLSLMAAEAADRVSSAEGESVRFDVAQTLELPVALRRRTVRQALARAFPEASRLEFEHVEALVRGFGAASFARDLPEGLRAASEYGTIVVSRAGQRPRTVAPSTLPIPGTADLGDAGAIFAVEVDGTDVSGTASSVVIDADIASPVLAIDGVRPGDRMRTLGMEGTKKLSDLLVDAKVPREERPCVPVVRDGDRIVWLAGVRMAEEYKVTPGTRRAVRLTWERGPGIAVGEKPRDDGTGEERGD